MIYRPAVYIAQRDRYQRIAEDFELDLSTSEREAFLALAAAYGAMVKHAEARWKDIPLVEGRRYGETA